MIDTLSYLTAGGYFELVRPMEHMMPGSSQPPLSECLDDVKKCDIYMLLIGKNYGSIDGTSGISFTENEFNCATNSSSPKIIIPFIADENALGLSSIQTDNVDRYDKFKQTVTTKYLTFVKKFTSPENLSTYVVLSLYKYREKKWVINDDVVYLCDRRPQYLDFMGNKRKQMLNVFVLVGKENDRADYFSKRMGRYELGLQKEYIEIPLKPADFIRNGGQYEKHKKLLITHLMDGFFDNSDDIPGSIEECFNYFSDKKLNNIFINLQLCETDITSNNDILKVTLEKFFSELNAECAKRKITFFSIISFQFSNEEVVKEEIAKWITDNDIIKNNANVNDINMCTPILVSDVTQWIDRYIIDKNIISPGMPEMLEKKENFMNENFNNKTGIDMNQAFLIMSKLLQLINE